MLVVGKVEPHRAVIQSLLRNRITHFQFSKPAFLCIKYIGMCFAYLLYEQCLPNNASPASRGVCTLLPFKPVIKLPMAEELSSSPAF